MANCTIDGKNYPLIERPASEGGGFLAMALTRDAFEEARRGDRWITHEDRKARIASIKDLPGGDFVVNLIYV